MSDVVIRAQGLGKKYLIGHEAQGERYTALRDVVSQAAQRFFRQGLDLVTGRPLIAGDTTEEFWALKDVDFEITRGTVVGIIGRNGAGKSTLLKILSRITEPTEGRIEIKGRVASLLEVGTGFHPELTGRENIYLNGAILGMSRAEIRARFDEIVEFAEIERFLDTPVKRYSSGMYVRLAFAVAAHLEPEILIVDEVLAVGDAEFQKKCLGKMEDVAKTSGRTVLFVSHNLPAVAELCATAMLMDGGQMAAFGATAMTIRHYQMSQTRPARAPPGLEALTFTASTAGTPDGALVVSLIIHAAKPTRLTDLCLAIRDARGTLVSTIDARKQLGFPSRLAIGRHAILVRCPNPNLVTGTYDIELYIANDDSGGNIPALTTLTVPAQRQALDEFGPERQGVVRLPFTAEWAPAR